MRRHRCYLCAWLLLGNALSEPALAQPPQLNPPVPAPPPLPTPVTPVTSTSTVPATPDLIPSPDLLGKQATKLLRELLPREYEGRKKWGLTEEVVSGLDISRDGFQIKTHRRRKTVKHGLWKRYKATLVDPQQQLQLTVKELRDAGPGRAHLDVVLVGKLDLEAQFVKYQRNLRLFSLTALADASVQLTMALELGAALDPTKLPPDVVFDVVVKDAELRLLDFELRELSDLRGEVAHQIGKQVRKFAAEELQDQRERLVEKLNKKIDKKRDELRFSISDLLPEKLRGAAHQESEQAPAKQAEKQPSAHKK